MQNKQVKETPKQVKSVKLPSKYIKIKHISIDNTKYINTDYKN
jgi:Cu/Ag efflux protein CusF